MIALNRHDYVLLTFAINMMAKPLKIFLYAMCVWSQISKFSSFSRFSELSVTQKLLRCLTNKMFKNLIFEVLVSALLLGMPQDGSSLQLY